MKLKTNKACDLSSISVFPPQSRRLSTVTSGAQASQHWSQPSQQSFSQGLSSQHDMFSQLSQTSLDEAPTNDQRFSSQERENPLKKTSCLPPIGHTREESQMPVARSSSSIIRNWNSVPFQDHRGRINEELDCRIGMIETSLNKIGMILDSVQSDIMHINKGTKEVSLEMEGMRQKLIVLDSSLQLMKKGQEEIKLGLDGSLKSLSEQLSRDAYQDKLQQILLVLSALPEQIEASLLKLQSKLQTTCTKKMQETTSSLKASVQRSPSIVRLSSEVTGCYTAPQGKKECPKNPAISAQVSGQATVVPIIDMRGWNSVMMKKSVKVEQATSTRKELQKEQKPKQVSLGRQETRGKITIESDDDIDGGFSCLIEEKETGIQRCMIENVKEETEQILRKARRSKRKYCNPIIIN